jgi:hypothetical protein
MDELKAFKGIWLNSLSSDNESYIKNLSYLDVLLKECIMLNVKEEKLEVTKLNDLVKKLEFSSIEIFYDKESRCINVKTKKNRAIELYYLYPYELAPKTFLYKIAKEINSYLNKIGKNKIPVYKMDKKELWDFVLENRQILIKI